MDCRSPGGRVKGNFVGASPSRLLILTELRQGLLAATEVAAKIGLETEMNRTVGDNAKTTATTRAAALITDTT